MAYHLSVLFACMSVLAASPSDTSGIAGTWRGRSVCITDAPACHNEDVIYYVKDVPDRDDVVFIQADKLVDGKAVTMGAGQWQYDRKQHRLEWSTPKQVWLLKIAGNRMEGTLTLADKTIFRKMTLEKDK
jgi:hypothetical protein